MASRGSVIPLFVEQIQSGQSITITDPEMTRFMMNLDNAVNLVEFCYEHGRNGDIFVQKAPAASMGVLAQALTELFGVPNHPINIIGTRHGEKKHETLMTREEKANAEDLGDYFRIAPDMRDLNYSEYVERGETALSASEDYTSETTRRLDLEEVKTLVSGLDLVRDALAANQAATES